MDMEDGHRLGSSDVFATKACGGGYTSDGRFSARHPRTARETYRHRPCLRGLFWISEFQAPQYLKRTRGAF